MEKSFKLHAGHNHLGINDAHTKVRIHIPWSEVTALIEAIWEQRRQWRARQRIAEIATDREARNTPWRDRRLSVGSHRSRDGWNNEPKVSKP